jgi:diguanylate cyclase (GGDEF)-like protein/excisionase family DNA binding protein
MQKIPSGDEVFTIDELAAYLKADRAVIAQMAEAGELPGVRIGGDWRFHRDIVRRWLLCQDRVSTPARQPTGGTIFVVDDDGLVRRIVRDVLTAAGFTVELYASGEEALAALRDHEPVLTLVDVVLPGIDGYEVCRRIRRDPMLGRLLVVLMTSRSSISDKMDGVAAGADDYIVKPFDPQDLVARLQMLLRRSQRDQQLNPLTLLPGNRAIQQALEARLRGREPFAACYADLDNFKAFNDRYGFVAGDDVIRLLGRVIVDSAAALSIPDVMTGHIGGDDFLFITPPEHAVPLCDTIVREFDRAIVKYYAPEDRARGGIRAVDRSGVEREFPFVSVSIAIVLYRGEEDVHPAEIAQAGAEIKRYLKRTAGSKYLVDRRALRPTTDVLPDHMDRPLPSGQQTQGMPVSSLGLPLPGTCYNA